MDESSGARFFGSRPVYIHIYLFGVRIGLATCLCPFCLPSTAADKRLAGAERKQVTGNNTESVLQGSVRTTDTRRSSLVASERRDWQPWLLQHQQRTITQTTAAADDAAAGGGMQGPDQSTLTATRTELTGRLHARPPTATGACVDDAWLNGNLSWGTHLRATSPTIWDHTALPATRRR